MFGPILSLVIMHIASFWVNLFCPCCIYFAMWLMLPDLTYIPVYQLIVLAFPCSQFENVICKMDLKSIGSIQLLLPSLRQSFSCQHQHNGQLYGQIYMFISIYSIGLLWMSVTLCTSFWTLGEAGGEGRTWQHQGVSVSVGGSALIH